MTPARPPAVALRGIHKRFGAVQANQDVDLTVPAGTVHGIVGENGAGKSTLMSVLYGFYTADAGDIAIDGQPLRIASARDAIAAGIGMVHQHFMLVDDFSALDNVLLGAEPHWQLPRARAALRAQLEALMAQTGLAVRLDRPVAQLPVGERQRLEILKALVRGARILILDEPTAVLTPQETDQLFGVLRTLRAQGTTILLITHKLREIMALCDAVTVMRAGRVVLDTPVADTSADALAQAMVGRRVNLGRDTHAAQPGEALLRAEHLTWRDALGVPRVHDVSLALHAGEIVGIAGVSGNGQSELLDLLSGLRAPQQGRLTLGGQTFEPGHWLDPRRARALKLAHVPEDRHARALVMDFPAWESAVLGYHRWPAFCRRGFMRAAAMRDATVAMMQGYDVRPPDPSLSSRKFSGGNQQKLVLAREAWAQPQVLLVGQPTRGVDIGAIEAIHARLRALRDAGGAVLVVSSELDEVLALADRVIVMNAGRIAGERPVAQCDETTLGRLMAGLAGAGQGTTEAAHA
ncbi:MAG: ABC transporter ATP-binding protein [Burkholderiaceae bacterium]|nr:ABC transporter ATP-binding protein [Burkholderiaceae bacterium]